MNFTNDGWLRQAQNFDKLSHAGGSCLAVCLLWAIARMMEGYLYPLTQEARKKMLRSILITVLAGGIVIEIWQGFYGHGFSWRDVVADVVGVLIAYGAIGG